ncbi:uncharacterized protein LOC133287787 [Gastrolobium bilobum]|uniref:uncharacterized protein LOC133287787 n=1 Tax=Gastrolobium bilobum TaxID=150636 RepID=UPI002AB2FA74|nr:uncharacterized protein LOC133287787 [Gastrolobium bilobum]
MGKNVSLAFMKKKMENLWAQQGKVFVTDLENDYFLVRFSDKKDMDFALTAEYVNTSLIKNIGNWLGKFVRIDAATTSLARGRFARMCVELNLTQPLQVEYKVEGRLKRVEYEELYLICYGCGRYGHRLENCPNKICGVPDLTNSVMEKDLTSQETVVGDVSVAGVETSKFGPWMQAEKQDNTGGENMNKVSSLRSLQSKDKKNVPAAVEMVETSSQFILVGNQIENSRISQELKKGHHSQELVSEKRSEKKNQLRLSKENGEANCAEMVNTNSTEYHGMTNMTPVIPNHESNVHVVRGVTGQLDPKPPDPMMEDCEQDADAKDMEVLGANDNNMLGGNEKQGLGAARREFGNALKTLVKKNMVDVAVVLEPRTQSGICKNIMKKVGFDSFVVEEAQGFAGGIWIMWHSEKCARFASVLEDCKVADMGCDGPFFTWQGPKWTNLKRVYKRLDRAVANVEWRMLFDGARVSSLPRLLSDHNPILIKLFEDQSSDKKKPFRFFAAWQEHQNFVEFLNSNWDLNFDLPYMLHSLIPEINVWNRRVFSNIDRKKNWLIKRIAYIQGRREANDSDHLHAMEKDCQEQFGKVLLEEELFWFQKSRQKWITDGDRNTKFYHLSTVVRRSTNKIFKLKSEGDAWVTNAADLKEMAVNYFKDLFNEDFLDRRWISSENLWPKLSVLEKNDLERCPNDLEIKQALFNIGALKAPGIDGYPTIFFQKNWDLIKKQVCSLIYQIWDYPNILASINSTLLVLIPKVQNPIHISQFRPISLCPVVYKIVSKIIVSRLKIIMDKVVSPAQSSFVPSRHIQDNIIVVQELDHSMRNMRVYGNLWHPIKAGKGGPKVSHLLFDDDLMLFLEASEDQMHILLRCLNLGFKRVANIGKYLGALIQNGRVTKSTFASMVDRAKGRLTSWQAKTLSQAGRIVLSQSVLSSLPYYHMQYGMLPKANCNDLEKLQRSFIWGDSADKRHMHLVGWDAIARPNNQGGLGIKKLTVMNEAFIGKIVWTFLTDQDCLWVKVLQAKYGNVFNRQNDFIRRPGNSNLWKAMCDIWHKLRPRLIWDISDGSTIKFWEDNWVNHDSNLASKALIYLSDSENERTIKDYVTVDGVWDYGALSNKLPNNLI